MTTVAPARTDSNSKIAKQTNSEVFTSFIERLDDYPYANFRTPDFFYLNHFRESKYCGDTDSGPIYATSRNWYGGLPDFAAQIKQLCAKPVAAKNKEGVTKRLKSLEALLDTVRTATEPLINIFREHLKNFQELLKQKTFVASLKERLEEYTNSAEAYMQWLTGKELKSIAKPQKELPQSKVERDLTNQLLAEPDGQGVFYGYTASHYGTRLNGFVFTDPSLNEGQGLGNIIGPSFNDSSRPARNQIELASHAESLAQANFEDFAKSAVKQYKRTGLSKDFDNIGAQRKEFSSLLNYIDYAYKFIKDFELVPLIQNELCKAIAKINPV